MKQKQKVAKMFDDIAPKYDFLNHLLSMGIDKSWRKRLVRMLNENHPQDILDIATGTGDLAIAISKIKPRKITGIDISEKMLEVGKVKMKDLHLDTLIDLQYGDCEQLKFENESFDALSVAFGVRNFEDLDQGLSEMCRVLRSGAKAFILEFSMPRNRVIRAFYLFYFVNILPFVGKLVSGHSEAYNYLPESVQQFPQDEAMRSRLLSAGFQNIHYYPLSFGIATIYVAQKN